jgi:hypothetical protein
MSKQLAEAKNDLIIAQANYIKAMNNIILAKQEAHNAIGTKGIMSLDDYFQEVGYLTHNIITSSQQRTVEDNLAFAQEYHDHLNNLQTVLNEEGALYVVGYGTDCDGSSSYNITGYTDLDKAIDSSNASNEASDGIRFNVVGKKEAEYYCQSFMRNFDEIYFSKR